MKKNQFEKKIVLIVGAGLIVALVPWFIFNPFNSLKLFNDILMASDASERFGEECKIYVKDSWSDPKNSSQEVQDIQAAMNGLSVSAISHILKKDDTVYRFIKSSFPFGSVDDEQKESTVVLETIHSKGNEYARYDTSGPWITFPHTFLPDMNEYIQQMFRDQFYYSLDDIQREGVHFKEVRTDSDDKKSFIFRGHQTEKSLEIARQLIQYSVGSFEVVEQFADVIIDPERRSILKTVLHILFEYKDENNKSMHVYIPMYQECVPVHEKELEVHIPSNVINVSKEQARQYLLFKVLP